MQTVHRELAFLSPHYSHFAVRPVLTRYQKYPRIFTLKNGWKNEHHFVNEWKSKGRDKLPYLNRILKAASIGMPRQSLSQSINMTQEFVVSYLKREGYSYNELKILSDDPSDLEKEITELQDQLFMIVPTSLELLDMRRDYVYLAAFIYDLKDLRKLLLKMGEALR